MRVPKGRCYRLNDKAVKMCYSPHNVKMSGHCTRCGSRCVAVASVENVVEREVENEKESKGLLHLRSLDVLICSSNKAAL